MNKCPICNKKLTTNRSFSYKNNKYSKYTDYECKYKEDHFFVKRINCRMTNESKVKIRLSDETSLISYYLKINYDENTSEVWVKDSNKITINQVFVPDYSDLTKLKEKIKTYLNFS